MLLSASTSGAILSSAKRICLELELPPMCIAVVDAGAHLIAFVRMDGAMLAAVDISIRKARTSALFARDSAELGDMAGSNPGAQSLLRTNGGVITIGGGIVLLDAVGNVVGGLGVSGGSPDQDEQLARATHSEFPVPADSRPGQTGNTIPF